MITLLFVLMLQFPAEAPPAAEFIPKPRHVVGLRVMPKYTPEAIKASVSAVVSVKVWIEKEGKVAKCEPVSKVGYGLEESACKAISAWKFAPGKDSDMVIDVSFGMLNVPLPVKP